jgi:pentatricopeptide repeat protein
MREFLQQLIGTQMFDNFITKRLYGSGEADVAFFDMAVDRFLKSAGMLSNFDLGGRFMDASGLKTNEKIGPYTNKSRPKMRPVALVKKDGDPLLQSARVHRKLKTIVPPEPTGEGLPPVPVLIETSDYVKLVSIQDDDEVSRGSAGSYSKTSNGSAASRKGIKMNENHGEPRFFYDTFPSKLNKKFFGTPRPLSAAVIAEFDRQRKDAAQFRRKAPRLPKETKGHIHRAHSTVDPIKPPSPEVATFTVFFMAFTAVVGKELVGMTEKVPNKTILSTYVPTTIYQSDTISDEGASDSVASDSVDHEEKAGVAEMKTIRPTSGMFGDEDEDDVSTQRPSVPEEEKKLAESPIPSKREVKAPISPPREEKTAHPATPSSQSDDGLSTASDSSKPRERFRDKLSDLQIEEAKATGRAQLGLAFEMLTMMKKRGLKADPETYQCLIDACGRVGDTKRATDLLAKMHEDGIVADGTVYACLVSAFSDNAWKDTTGEEELPEWANSTAVEMDWNKLQKRSLIDRIVSSVVAEVDDDEADGESEDGMSAYQKLRSRLARRNKQAASVAKGLKSDSAEAEDSNMEFFVTETVERQIALGENLLEIVFPDISIDTENEVCPRCNFILSDDDVVSGWKPDSNDYTTSCPNCTQRFVPHFCVQCTAPTFVGSRGPASSLMCERLSPWVLQKEIRNVMSSQEGIDNLLRPEWRHDAYKNGVLWWNLVLSCMRYRFPFSFLLQGSFEQNLIAPMPED